ncbi:Ig-like domain-containing protein [Chitinophaga pinensis]|uniref:T9SS type B sorting domain-containing protein n=1 Tax=Chitinophaga pinensis TaxID=79329 RepID=A0A5C6LR59_9BACT|nr:Ig-like domain-containing protein [Chitinophaga pinensis]TWV95686.1 T9SS type B sorting domain-containing protein [Chitinophaga pinensis]
MVTAVGVPADGYYKAGQNLDITVDFSEAIAVTTAGGSPYVALNIGGTVVAADYIGKSAPNTLQFRYTVVSGNNDADGIQITGMSLNGGTITDQATNNANITLNNIASTANVRVNTNIPTVTLSAPSTPVNGDFTVTAVFSEAVAGLTESDFAVTNGIASALQTTDNITYTVTITPNTNGTTTVNLPAAAAENIGTNPSLASNTVSVTADFTAPVVTSVVMPANGYYVEGNVLNFTVNFSEVVNVTTAGGIPYIAVNMNSGILPATYSAGTGTNALTFSYTVQAGDEDMDGIGLGAGISLGGGGTILDAATNNAILTLNSIGNGAGVKVNTTHPTVNITPVTPSPNNAPFTVTVTFSEAVTGLTAADFTILSTTVSNVSTTDNITYTVQLAPSMDGNFSLSLPANKTANIAGNGNQASNTYNFTYDATAPVVSSVAVPANGYYKAGQALNFTVRFDENITINTAGGNPTLNLTIGSTSVAATYTGTNGTDGLNFSYTVVAGEQDMDGITVGALALNGATIRDAATNNANLTLNSVGNTFMVRVNTTHPTVNLSTAAVSPLNAPFNMTVTFSEAVTGLNASDFTVTNGTPGTPTTSDNITYTVLVTPGTDGTVNVSLPADAAVNIGDNGNQASNTLSLTYDATAPVVTSVAVPPNGYYKAGDVLNFTVNFNENITVAGTPQLSLTIGSTVVNASYTAANGTNGMDFAYTVVDGDQDMDGITIGTLTLNGGTIKDAATNDVNLTLNSVAPTTGIFVNTTSATVALTTTAAALVNAPFTVTATFSEAVTGLTAGDFTVTNGTASALQTTNNITYTVTITPTADGTVTVQLPAAAAVNIGNNATQASNTLSVDYDATAPVVTSVAVPVNGNYKSGEPLNFIVRFSEDIILNTIGGNPALTLTVGTATVNATYTGTNGADGLNFTYTVQNGDFDQNGIAINALTLNGAAIQDAATNNATLTLNNVGNTSLVLVDGIVPTVTSVTVPANGYYKAGNALNFTVRFSENITLNTTGGSPTLALTIGTATVNATYTGMDNADGLNFAYTVVTGDQDMDGITVGALALNGATIQDATTNNADLTLNNVGNTANVRVNTTTATVVLTAPATLVNTPFTVTATFSEAVTGLTAGDFTATNGAVTNLQTTDNITYTVTVTPIADGVVTVQVPAAAAVNIGNNPTQVSNTLTVTYDATAPVVASVAVPAAAYYKAGDVLNFIVRFSENINVNTTAGNPALSVIIGSTTVQATYTGTNGSDGLNFSYTVVDGDMDMDGIQVGTLALNSAVIRDLAGNNANTTLNNVNPTNNVFVNTTHPTVTLSTAAASPTNAPFTATITFSEAVSGFAIGDVTATNATLSSLQTTNNITFTVLVTPAADGAVSLNVPADVATNIGNNGNQASNTLSLTYDATAPVVTSVNVPVNGYYKAGDVLNFIVHFNENLTINTTGGTPQLSLTIGTNTVTAANTTNGSNSLSFSYTVVDGDLDMDGITVGALTLNGATIKDAATNNANLTLNGIAPTNNVFVNTVHPTVTVSTTAPALTNAPFTATIIFSEAVTGFTPADVTATNAAVSSLQTTDNITYTILVTPVADGTVAVNVPADVAVNIGNNGNQASNTISLTYDVTAPVVTSVTVPADGYYKAGDVLNFTVKFSENITLNTTGGTPYLTIAIGATNVNAAYTGLAGTDGLNFSYAVVDGDQDMDGIQLGVLAINGATIRDAVGNNADLSLHNVGNTSNVKVNTTHATVVLTSAAALVNAPFTATVTFSEAVTGLTASDFTATNAAVSNLQTTDNITYTVTVTPAADGAVTVQLPAAAAVNIGNNATQASNTLSVTYDATAPVVTSVAVPANGYYKAGQTLEFTVTFSEAITLSTTGGTPAINITIGTTNVQAAYNRVAGANGLVFSYTVQPGQMDLDGITVGTLTLNGGTIKDAATNNANLVLNSVGNTTGVFVHTASPSVQLSTNAPARTNTPFTVTIVFNEAVSGLAAGDFNITNGTAGTLSTTDNITYTLQVTPTADGTVTIQLPAGQAVNVVSNGNTASNTLTLTYDATAPVITAGQSFDVIERSAVGTLAGKVIATEAAGTLQTWTIVTDDSNGAFSIDANGNVLVLDQTKLNAKVNSTVTLTVTVSDGLNTSVAVPVTINVKEKNLAPTLDPIGNTTICPEGSVHTIQLTGASATEPAQTYSFAIITDKPGNFDQLSVSAAGVVTYQLKTSATGTAKVTVTIKDNGGVANGGVDTLQRSFNITVATLGQVTITSDKGATISKGDIVHLTATGGTIFKWDAADGIISGQQSAVLEVRPMENTTYHVTVSNAAGCSNTADFTVNVIADFKVDATNLLTPNGDGKNDKWVIRNLDSYPDNEVKIFDRTGRLIYTRRNYSNDWDGTYNGSPLAEGTYYYVLTIEGGAKTAKGYITIIRDRR